METDPQRFWSRVRRAPWRKDDFYKRIVRYLRHGNFPEFTTEEKNAKTKFKLRILYFYWDNKNQTLALKNNVPFPENEKTPGK